jgi:hypothetical protein
MERNPYGIGSAASCEWPVSSASVKQYPRVQVPQVGKECRAVSQGSFEMAT